MISTLPSTSAFILLSVLHQGVSNSTPSTQPANRVVGAVASTNPMESEGDAADDAAFWVHPQSPDSSLLIGTNKKAGLVVYRLDGTPVQELLIGRPNNVDVIHRVPTHGWSHSTSDIAVTSNRDGDVVNVFIIDPATGTLTDAGVIPAGLREVYGICGFPSRDGSAARFAVNNKSGTVRVFDLVPSSGGRFTGVLVREFHVGTQVEGMVADIEHNRLYVGEESVGVWCYDLSPGATPERRLLDIVADSGGHSGGNLARDVEGITLYELPDGEGYLIVSCQGEDRFAVYDRVTHAYKGSFSLTLKASDPLYDPVTHTDGITATSRYLGARFPAGAFAAQDDNNGQGQNFKIASWSDIASAFDPPLRMRDHSR